MEFGLSEEQQIIVDTVRRFVEQELYPLEDEVERSGVVPRELGREIQDKVTSLGFYAPNVPVEFGGGGLDHLTFTLLERELGRASMALSVFWGRPSNILCACNEEQRERYLLPLRARRKARCPRDDRTGGGFGPARHEDLRPPGRRRLRHQRHQTLHQPCRHCRLRDYLRRHRSGLDAVRASEPHYLLPHRPRYARFRGPSGLQRGVAPRLPQLQPDLRRLPRAGRAGARRRRQGVSTWPTPGSTPPA